MTDIFISYARADRKKVRRFAEALEREGWRVWWDLRIRSGSSFDRVIEQALAEARCVVVIWSQNSVESDWVRVEAGDGLIRSILISIAIEQDLILPLQFRNVHTDLVLNLAVYRAPSVFNKIVEDIEALIGRAKPTSETTKAEGKQKRREIRPKEKEVSELQKVLTNTIGMEFVLIPAGSFKMGGDVYDREKPIHQVVLNHPFYLQTTAVTQRQWQRVIGDKPAEFKDCDKNYPVKMVSWKMTKQFIRKLNEKEGSDNYRLPSEAEWEYACRAGTATEFSFGDDDKKLGEYAWFKENSDDMTHSVGTKKPNDWGLYDMHGNVWEWVEDDYHDNYDGASADGRAWIDKPRGQRRVMRGGSWSSVAGNCRSATRWISPGTRTTLIGFRLARSVTLDPGVNHDRWRRLTRKMKKYGTF